MANWSKWFILGLTFKVQKTTLQSHDSYFTQKCSNTNLVFEKWLAFEKWQNCKGYSKAKSSKLTYLVAEYEDQK